MDEAKLDTKLEDFLDNGPEPIVLSFSSMPLKNPSLFKEKLITALNETNNRRDQAFWAHRLHANGYAIEPLKEKSLTTSDLIKALEEMVPFLEIHQEDFFDRFREILGVENLVVSDFYKDMLVKGIKSGEIKSDIDVVFVARSIYFLSSQHMKEGFEKREGTIQEFIEERADQLIGFIKYGIGS